MPTFGEQCVRDEAFERSEAEVCAPRGAQRRGTWVTRQSRKNCDPGIWRKVEIYNEGMRSIRVFTG